MAGMTLLSGFPKTLALRVLTRRPALSILAGRIRCRVRDAEPSAEFTLRCR